METTILGQITALDAIDSQGLAQTTEAYRLHFADGSETKVSANTAKHRDLLQMARDAQALRMPVFLQLVDDALDAIDIPTIGTVEGLEPSPDGSGGLDIRVSGSNLRHRLPPRHPNFQTILELLQRSLTEKLPVAIQGSYEGQVLNAVVAPVSARLPLSLAPAPREFVEVPFAAPAPMPPEVVADLFNQMRGMSCNPIQTTSGCIPFLYPDDGCWARAHEMCRFLAPSNPGKVWIYGNLNPNTPNNPACRVHWFWHVAPILNVMMPAGPTIMVMDPSMTEEPVPIGSWSQLQRAPQATIALTDPTIFLRSSDGRSQLDPTFQQTNEVLAKYRLCLRTRALRYGPPPYTQCHVGTSALMV